jgi:ech hydrogenase subunit A
MIEWRKQAVNSEFLISVAVILPILAGLILLIAGKGYKKVVVLPTALILAVTSILLMKERGFSWSPDPVIQTVVMSLDLLLLLYFLYVGFHDENIPVIGLTLIQALLVAYFEVTGGGHHGEPTLMVDGLSSILLLVINFIGSLVCIYAIGYMDEHEEHLDLERSKQPRFFLFLLLLLGAMNGLVSSNDIFWLYFFWEITTLCCYELIRHDGTEIALNNALRALWMGLVGGVALLGAIYIGNYTLNSLSLATLIESAPSPLLYLAFALMAIAAFTKSAQLPFQSWLLGAMVAPTPVSALLHSSTMVNAGVYLVLRFVPAIQGTLLTYGIALVGVFTFMFTAIVALSQRFSKAILAYSTIGNLGLIIFCASMNTSLSYSAALILLMFHAMSKGLLFLCAGIIENRLHSRNIEDWEGLLAKLPITTGVMIIGIVSMFLPMFGVLLGKWAAVGVASSAPVFPSIVMITMMVIGSSATTLFWAKWLGTFTILPIREHRIEMEKVPMWYSFSTLTILGFDIMASLGSSYMVQHVVSIAVAPHYELAWSPGLLKLSTQLGSFMIIPLWIAMVTILCVGFLIYRSKGGKIVPAYLAGENVEGDPIAFRSTADTVVDYRVSGMFFDPDITEGRWNPWGTLVGILLNLMVLGLVII